ncbi:MAG: hypothetical protein ACHQK9_13245 [Reyranellales bacterium]
MAAPISTDRRRMRSERTRQAMIEAFLAVLRETSRMPTAGEIAERVGCSTRLIFARFTDMIHLSLAAADHALIEARAAAVLRNVDADRATRIRTQLEIRARTCETWLPLWRVVSGMQERSKELKARIAHVRELTIKRLENMFAPELSTLSDIERRRLLLALEAIVDFESWGRMRDWQGLSIEAACTVWVQAFERMLPPTPPAGASGDC